MTSKHEQKRPHAERNRDEDISKLRFAVDDLTKKIEVLSAVGQDLERQLGKLNVSVPEDVADPTAEKEGYVAYGSYAQSIILRKDNIRQSLSDVRGQENVLREQLKVSLDKLGDLET